MAMCQAAKEAAWLTGPLDDFRLYLQCPLVILGDKQGPPMLTQNPVFHPRSKHIAIQYHFTREDRQVYFNKSYGDDALTSRSLD